MHTTLWELVKDQRRRYLGAVLAILLAVALTFTVPLVIKTAIDRLVADGSTAFLPPAAATIVLLTALAGVFQYWRNRLAAGASERIVRALRDRLYRHIEGLPCSYHDRADSGDLVQRCTSDVETLRLFLDSQVVEIGRTLILIFLVTPLLLWLDWPLALASLALLPLLFTFAVVFFRRVQAQFLLTDQAEARMTTVLQENLTGIRVVRAFARQDFERVKFAAANRAFRDRHQRLIQLLGLYWASADCLCHLQVGITLIYGAARVLAGDISVGTLFAFVTYLGLVVWPVRQLGRTLTEAGKATVALKRLQEILAEPTEPAELSATPPALYGEIVFDGVGFGFADNLARPVLNDLSFRIKPGQTVALIGPPGAGKSAIVQLLLRLYDYRHGSIRLDGRELNTLPRGWLRSQIGVVLQEPFLYSKTVAANLRVGRHDADARSLERATDMACIHDAISGFRDGYQTLVGERGVTLSGGQRQRLALARALLKDPPLLILDDALSAVDSRTEAQIQAALVARQNSARRRTTLIIAHRLSSVVRADLILVLNQGRVQQAGTHAQLSRQPGLYRRLWQIQARLDAAIARDLNSNSNTEADHERVN